MTKLKVPSLVTILVLTTITIASWILFGVLRVFTTKPEDEVADKVLEELSPTLDAEALNQLENRIFFDESELPQSAPIPTPPTEVTEEAQTEVDAAPITTVDPEEVVSTESGELQQ